MQGLCTCVCSISFLSSLSFSFRTNCPDLALIEPTTRALLDILSALFVLLVTECACNSLFTDTLHPHPPGGESLVVRLFLVWVQLYTTDA